MNIGGQIFSIRYQWRAIIDILNAANDPDLDDWGKVECMIEIFYPDYEKIPAECMEEAMMKAIEFIDCGIKEDDRKRSPRLFDWEQDSGIIIPEINKVAGREIRMEPDLHWWTFFGYFLSIREGLFAEVLNIRQKKAKHQKLEKYEQEYYTDNKHLIDLKTPESAEVKAEKESIMQYLAGH